MRHLRRGDVVQVCDETEILAKCDGNRKLGGLAFAPEMRRYCGGFFRVSKRLSNIMVEGVGVKTINGAVILEDAECNGEFHEGCSRGCSLIWKEKWLRKVGDRPPAPTNNRLQSSRETMCDFQNQLLTCQAASLAQAAPHPGRSVIKTYLYDLLSGEMRINEFTSTMSNLILLKAQGLLHRRKRRLTGALTRTPSVSLDLQPGEDVQVRSIKEIEGTLDHDGRNRGLVFTPEMLRYCNLKFRVLKRVNRLLNEATGEMRSLTNTVVLDGVKCGGEAHGNCPRACNCLWREAWLKRTEQFAEPVSIKTVAQTSEASTPRVTIKVISDPDRLGEIEDAWDSFVDRCGDNPFFLSGFVKEYAKAYRSEGWTPLILVVLIDNAMSGIVPLVIKKRFGIRFVKFLLEYHCSPEIVIDDKYREVCMPHILRFLFNTLKCQFVDLVLPTDSSNLPILKRESKAGRVYLGVRPEIEMGHRIIPINCTWGEFIKARGSNFRQKFKKIERNLNRAGSWQIVYVEGKKDEEDTFKKILDVDKLSWKEGWHASRGISDEQLLTIFEGLRNTTRGQPDFKWGAWFLELNNETLAYALGLHYKETTFIKRTSYVERYRHLYPGIFVVHAAIHELFDKGETRKIDFYTDHSFMTTWAKACLPRVTIMMRKGILPTAMGVLLANEATRKTLHSILNS